MAQRRSADVDFALAQQLPSRAESTSTSSGLGIEPGVGDEEQLVVAKNVGLLRNFGLRRASCAPTGLAGKRIDTDQLPAALEADAAAGDRAGVDSSACRVES